MTYNLRATKDQMEEVIDRLSDELAKLRTGRATTGLIEDIKVDCYGALTPLKQVASLTVSDAATISVQPWDKSLLANIENAIRNSGNGLEVINDGSIIRVALPPLTAERRKEMSKLVSVIAEEAKVAMRTERQKAMQEVTSQEKAGKATEDDRFRAEKELNEAIKKYNDKVEQMVADKTKELETI
ncbi:ribosome recycling factor [Patescibacteria group bacterium]|jgi:ribosome recycling factor|nr:ribosome recycling factor [Patescibacteria group bacterium]